jgi:predicted  nucleic acid-binding Zn-ribbon protein
MSLWTCGIGECGERFDDAEAAIIHQTVAHDRHQCTVCGTVVPDGYFAIRHAFEEHSRAEYVRAYDADSSAVRIREDVKNAIEAEADLHAVVEELKRRDAL